MSTSSQRILGITWKERKKQRRIIKFLRERQDTVDYSANFPLLFLFALENLLNESKTAYTVKSKKFRHPSHFHFHLIHSDFLNRELSH